MSDNTCTCLSIADAARATFAGAELPTCELHDQPDAITGTPLALNDDEGLARIIGTALAQPTHATGDLA